MREVSLRLVAELSIDPRLDEMPTLPAAAEHQRGLAKRTGKDRAHYIERAEELEAHWTSLVADIERYGIREPLMCVGDTVIDGRHRLMAAKEAGIFEVPTIQVSGDGSQELILSTLNARRHLEPGYRAWAGVVCCPALTQGGSGRRPSQGKGARVHLSGEEVDSLNHLAQLVGVSVRTIKSAAWLYRETEGYPDIRSDVRMSIAGGAGLARLITYVQDRKAGESANNPTPKRRPDADYSHLAPKTGITLLNAFKQWDRLAPEVREETVANQVAALAGAPADIYAAIVHQSQVARAEAKS